MRTLFAAAFAATVFASANATVLWDNGYLSADGVFSDALASNGTQFYENSVADNFILSDLSTVETITFYGSSENWVFPDLTNFSDWEINVFDTSWNLVFGQTVAKADLNPVLTGNSNSLGGLEYMFTFNTNFNLNAGSYWLNIGSVNISPGDDGWAWSYGDRDLTIAFNQFDGNGFVVDPAFGDVAFVIEGEVVPEPATMLALGAGLAALAARRRRKA